MTVNLSLSPETEAKLKELATAEGKDLASLVLEAVEDKLAVADDIARPRQNLSADQWVARLRKWAASHRSLPFEADDSRESIYEGRGE